MKTHNKIVILLSVLISIIFLFPILWVTMSSFKGGSELFRWPPTIFPVNPVLSNYTTVLSSTNFFQTFYNSFMVASMSTLLTVIINTMAGYVFAKYQFRGNNFLFLLFLSTLMIPLEVVMIPIFQVVKFFGMYNSFLGLIIPPAATPAGVFLVRQFFKGVPNELMSAARIDGARESVIFVRIMLPIAKPVMSALAIFSFLWRWNDYLWPLLVVRSTKRYTLQLALANYSGEFTVDWNSLLAMSVITMIPVLIVFLVFQRTFIKGIVTSGLKG